MIPCQTPARSHPSPCSTQDPSRRRTPLGVYITRLRADMDPAIAFVDTVQVGGGMKGHVGVGRGQGALPAGP